jgi:hypothetical protein
MKPLLFVSLLAVACSGAKPAPATPDQPAAPTPAPAKAAPVTFTAASGWNGPAITASRTDANGPLVVHAAAPTAGYTLTLDTVAVQGDVREVQVTLLQPVQGAPVGRVVTDVELVIDAAKLAGPEPLAVAVRQMQVDCHYLVAPPWTRALVTPK